MSVRALVQACIGVYALILVLENSLQLVLHLVFFLIPGEAIYYGSSFAPIVVMLLLHAAAGLALFRFRFAIAAYIVRQPVDVYFEVEARQLFDIAIAFLGVYLVATAVPVLIYEFFAGRYDHDVVQRQPALHVAKILIGITLFVAAGDLRRLWRGLRPMQNAEEEAEERRDDDRPSEDRERPAD